ncbi:hypothetical protein ACAI28_000004 [Escherichia coli]
MSTDKEEFALYCEAKNDKVRKRLGIKGGFYWSTEKKLSVAISRCIAAMDDAGYDEDDFKKPVRVHLPVVNDLPPEGVFDTEFCNRYEKGGEDGITMVYIAPSPSAQDKPASTDNTSGEDAATVQSDSQPENAEKSESRDSDDDFPECEIPVATLSLTHRFLHLYLFGREFDGKYKHHATPEQRRDVIRIEMDMEDGNIQSLLTAVRSHPELDKLTNHHLGRLAHSVDKAFTRATTRRISPAEFDKFISTWMKTDNPDPEIVDIACGRSSAPMPQRVTEEGKQDDEEKPQPSGTTADEQGEAETMEPDATKHHQDTQPLDAQSQVNSVDAKYQELRAELHEARKNIPPKNPVDAAKLLAASRGEFVEGISDPNDPKWIPGHHIPSNEVEKTENDEQQTEENLYQEGEPRDEKKPDEAQEEEPEKTEKTDDLLPENAGSDPHRDCSDETGEAAASSLEKLDWKRQVVIAAVYGLCANPAGIASAPLIPGIAMMIANKLENFGVMDDEHIPDF